MLIDFSLSNYKTFGSDSEPECLSMIMGKSRNKPDHITHSGLLKTAAIYGANAAGKSNIVKCLKFLQQMITEKIDLITINANHTICQNDPDCVDKPIKLSLTIKVKDEDETFNSIEPYYRCDNLSDETQYNILRYDVEFRIGTRNDIHISKESIYEFDFNDFKHIITVNHENVSERLTEIYLKISKLEGKVKNLKFTRNKNEYIKMNRDKISNLSNEVATKISSISKTKKDEKNLLTLKLKRLEDQSREIKKALESIDLDLINKEIDDITNEIIQINKELDCYYAELQEVYDSDEYKNSSLKSIISKRHIPENIVGDSSSTKYCEKKIHQIYNWFLDTLKIIETDDHILPNLNSRSVQDLSKIINKFDVDVVKIDWSRIENNEEKKIIFNNLTRNNTNKIKSCKKSGDEMDVESSIVINNKMGTYLFSYFHGELSMYKLITYHSDGIVHNLSEESDGTRRIIELSATLLPTNKNKVYVIDELDRRLHPILSKQYVRMFFAKKTSEDEQLIFTTHETHLMTTELFRKDEIKIVERDNNGYSRIRSIEGNYRYNKRIDKMYLIDGTFGGIPKIKKN